MDFVKKNPLIIASLAVIVLVVAAKFLFLGGKFDELNQALAQRYKDKATVEGILRKERFWPVYDPTRSQQEPLVSKNGTAGFPDEEAIARAERLNLSLVEAGEKIGSRAVALNQRKQLDLREDTSTGAPLNVFPLSPNPSENQRRFALFRNHYTGFGMKSAIDKLRESLNPTWVPSNEEIDQRAAAYARRIRQENPRMDDAAISARVAEYRAGSLLLDMCRERASRHSIYMGPDEGILPHTSFRAGTGGGPGGEIGSAGPSEVDIWLAQTWLWIQQDVADAIRQTNGSNTVLTAPIKHLLALNIVDPAMTAETGGRGVRPSAGEDFADPAESPSMGPDRFKVSPAGHVSNPLYDVVQFSIVVRMDAAAVPTFMNNLVRDRFIYIRDLQLTAVDRGEEQRKGLFYNDTDQSDQQVVEGVFNCEALFLRQWTLPLMPESVRRLLGVPTASTGESGSGF